MIQIWHKLSRLLIFLLYNNYYTYPKKTISKIVGLEIAFKNTKSYNVSDFEIYRDVK